LTTNIRRQSSGSPVAGWLVRYQIAGGVPAVLDSSGSQVVDVLTDQSGNANVQVVPQGSEPGRTQLSVQVIRTSEAAGDLSRLAIGAGSTSICWTAAGLAVSATGPAVAELDSTLTFDVEVSNPGDMDARGVLVSSEVPFGLEYVDSQPAGQVFGDRIQWQIDQLAPFELQRLNVNFRATRAGQVTYCASARLGEETAKESCVTTTVVARALALDVEGPDRAEVGDQIQFRCTVTNTGDQTLTDVVVVDHFDPGLRHLHPDYPEASSDSPIERALGSLEPGQSQRFAVSFLVERPGELCHTLEVITAEGASEVVRRCVTASGTAVTTEPDFGGDVQVPAVAAELSVSKTRVGPQQRRVGQTVEFSMEVRNTGQVPLTQVRVVDQFDSALQPLHATTGAQRTGNQLVWYYPRIEPGQRAPLIVHYRCVDAAASACATVTVTAEQQVEGSDRACVEILPASSVPPAQEAPTESPLDSGPGLEPEPDAERGPRDADGVGPEANGALAPEEGDAEIGEPDGLTRPNGGLKLTVSDLGDPVGVGEAAKYYIAIENAQRESAKEVVLRVILPAGNTRFAAAPPPGITQSAASDGRTVTFSPIAEIRAGETVNFVVDVTLNEPGQAVLRAEVTSQGTTSPVAVEEDTNVVVPAANP
jgi:uncharacterized repeat protein (TIGR01451 family)